MSRNTAERFEFWSSIKDKNISFKKSKTILLFYFKMFNQAKAKIIIFLCGLKVT